MWEAKAVETERCLGKLISEIDCFSGNTLLGNYYTTASTKVVAFKVSWQQPQ